MKRVLRKIVNKLRKWRGVNHQQVFSEIYSGSIWGKDSKSEFYSGTGSDEPYARPYTDVITKFIKENKVSSIVDLGCGDFRIGSKITEENPVKYTGVDVVSDLIEYNNSHFASERINFRQVNIVKEKLPFGQMCLIRQVLQHLSNSDIQRILQKCKQYEYVIITEHHPLGDNNQPNVDKAPDGGIRLEWNSGVFLDHPPFDKRVEELLTVYPEVENNSKIVTFRVFI